MKLNGALKPRHGASTEGSSPGAAQLRKYRDKRYPKDTCKHAVNACSPQQQQRQQQLNERGVNNNKNKDDNNSHNNKNNNNNNNSNLTHLKEHRRQQEQPPPQGLQQPLQQQERRHRQQCDENILSSSEEGIITNINSETNKNSTQNRIQSVTATRTTTIIDYGSGKTATAIGATTAAPTTTTAAGKEQAGGSGNHDGIFKGKQEQEINITTRQTSRNSCNSSDGLTLSQHCKGGKTEHSAIIGVGEGFPIAHNHVTCPDKGQTKSQSSSNTTTRIRRLYCGKEVNKLSLIWEIYETPHCWRTLTLLTVIISRLFKQFKSFLLWLAFVMFTTGNPVAVNRRGAGEGGSCRRVVGSSSLANIMRASQPFVDSLDRICFKSAFISRAPFTTSANSVVVWLLVYGAAATMLLPPPTLADEGDNFFSPNDIAIGEATTEFDYASRGQKKFGDKCDNTLECGFPGSVCDARKKSCQCTEDLPVTNHIDKCGKEAAVNESCFFNEQCEVKYFQTECRDGRCVCRFDMTPIWLKDGTVECKGRQDKKGPETYIDPAMIGVLVGMALMFIIICVVLRLFSQARWRENRTIFNTPNPRLMNVSLLRESKLLHGQERRGSRMSVRAPSRQPSMASLRPHSPNPSLGSRSNSHGSNGSATSLRSTRSNSVSPAINNAHHERKGSTYHPHQHHQQPHQQHHHQPHPPLPPPASVQQQQQQPNIIANPVAESVTVEIIEPGK